MQASANGKQDQDLLRPPRPAAARARPGAYSGNTFLPGCLLSKAIPARSLKHSTTFMDDKAHHRDLTHARIADRPNVAEARSDIPPLEGRGSLATKIPILPLRVSLHAGGN